MNIEKMLLNNSRKAMLDNIQALDKKTLQKELKEHLQKEFQFYDELQRKDNIISELKYGIQKIRDLLYEKFRIHDEDGCYSMNDTDLQDFYDILDKIKELEENDI